MLLLLSASRAFETGGVVWSTGNLPVVIDWAGLPSGMSHDDTVSALDAAASAWSEAACTPFSVTFREGEDSELVFGDGVNSLRFVEIDESEPPAIVYRRLESDLPRETRNGHDYAILVEADVGMEVGATWMADGAIDAGACTDAWSFQASVTRAIGFVAGLDANCEGGPRCDAREELASMAIEPEPCSTEISSLGRTTLWASPSSTALRSGPPASGSPAPGRLPAPRSPPRAGTSPGISTMAARGWA